MNISRNAKWAMNQSEKDNTGDLSKILKMVQGNRRTIHRLRDRLNHLEKVVDLLAGEETDRWLYRNREERMDANHPLFQRERAQFHLARYEFACPFVDGRDVADIACGTGYGSDCLKQQGNAKHVTGIDICPQTILYAENRYGGDGVTFKTADACQTGLPDASVDVVVSFETIEHVADDRQLINELSRVLRKDGLLIGSVPNQWPLEIATYHQHVYDRQSFSELILSRFRIRQLYNQNSGTESPFNHGQPAGIVPTTDENQHLAECFIVVAEKVA